jgi:hypothetical protein
MVEMRILEKGLGHGESNALGWHTEEWRYLLAVLSRRQRSCVYCSKIWR